MYDNLHYKLRHIYDQLNNENIVHLNATKEQISNLIFYDKIHSIVKKYREAMEIKQEGKEDYENDWEDELILLI
jgi:hypothetical protein